MPRKQRVTVAALPAEVKKRLLAGRTRWIDGYSVTSRIVLYSKLDIRTALVHSIARVPTDTLPC